MRPSIVICFLVHSFHGEWLHFCVQTYPSTSSAPEFFLPQGKFPPPSLAALEEIYPKNSRENSVPPLCSFCANVQQIVCGTAWAAAGREPFTQGWPFVCCLILSSIVGRNNVERLFFGRSVGELMRPRNTSRKTNSPHFATDYTTKEIF